MRIKLLLLIVLMSTSFAMSQSKALWQKQSFDKTSRIKFSKQNLPQTQIFNLNIEGLKQALIEAPKRKQFSTPSNVVLSFPNSEGKLESFRIVEASVLHPDLAERYPDIKSYAGQGIEDPTSVIRFSVSPLGFQSMRLSANKPASFIEAYTEDLSQYVVFKRADKIDYTNDFECSVTDSMNRSFDNGNDVAYRNADDGILRTYRLAVSTTGEYTAYHGGTKALALAAINATMTRVNGVFENEFNVTMVLIANNDTVIYTNSGNDPYTSSGSYNGQLQSTLTSNIGESNYDIGHLFARASNNGNAGCIGCVCVNNQKGSGFTSRTDPEGDPFDIDYVAHEIGHQFGGNHTWTFNGNEGTNAQMEPGSGSTIMGYAGITGATDVQSNSDPYFHARSIEQITDYIKTTSCQTNTNTGNAVPTANAGLNYTIPKGTAFVLDGSGSDSNGGDVLTYCWEQYDENNASTTYPSVTATSGVAFRSYSPTTDTKRYFPRLSTIKSGATSWQWEAVPNVARSLNFRMTVRDNRAGGANNNSDDMVVTVNGTAGPFVVNTPNSNVTWSAGSTQAVTWDVAGTTGNGVNAANVDIFLSTDGGDTYPIALATGVANDGSHDIVVPNNQGSTNRVMVKGANNIFFDISNSNFTISGQVVCNANVPNGLAASSVGSTTATLSWDAVPGATYDLRYRTVGSSSWTTSAVAGISSALTNLSALTQYEAQVRSKCTGGSNSAYSSLVNFTTTEVQLNYCASSGNTSYQTGVSRVIFGSIDNADGPAKDVGYEDFTNISTTVTQSTSENLTVYVNTDGNYRVDAFAWIDWNKDGDFGDSGEAYDLGNISNVANGALPTLSIAVPGNAQLGSTRMRVSARYNSDPTSCQTNFDGEVEDYTIIVEANGPDTIAPVITLNGASTINLNVGDSYTDQGATATDNVDGDLTSSIVTTGSVNTAIAGTYSINYNVSDAAGNAATQVIRTINVIADTTKPVITLIGASTISINVGDSYTDQGATATDNVDGDLTSSIVTTGSVNTALAGTYSINYNVSDAAGNPADTVTRTVNVNEVVDNVAPVITLVGASTINLTVGDSYTDQGATAIDNVDGDLTSSIVTTGSVNTAVAGTYSINYNVSDAAGNTAAQVTRTVNVSEPSSGCSGGISSFPYSEGFENTLGAWTQSSSDDIDWTVDANGTPSSNTGPASASQDTYYVYVEASVNGEGYPDKRAILNSPCFDLSGLSTPTFSFDYHMYGASDMGTITLEASTDDGGSWTSIWNESGNKGNSWLTANVDLSAYAGGTVQLRFNRFVGSTWQADIAIDNVSLSEPVAPTCNDGIQNGDETGVDCGGSSCTPCSTSDVVLNEGYFETGWDGWVDGGSDAFRYSGSRSYEGSYSIRLRDNTNSSTMTLSNIDVTPYSQVVVDFYFYVLSMENGEDFWLQFYDGSSYITAASWVAGSGIENNNFYNATVTLTPAQYNFAVNSGFRFRCDASGNQDYIYIDQVTITGTNSGRGGKDNLALVGSLDASVGFEEDFRLYPNPVKGDVLNIELPEGEKFSYTIKNMVGQTIDRGSSEGKVNISKLESGMYFIEVNDGEDIMIKKFMRR
ncbi:immunoglobulin-like domain-containing protein [Ichthyenterobacterium magnum]|uniref:Putative secreted protein (Por secretion system target) n=1 Tax=Ichthyenterobacterium magnum TaxID=1230530 RepID=A0A420DXD0_9FLAO|nr:immunoglobulin-like domain-containing protein [Ichthyenterobacterium magnum]RKE98898.1 putative secreted protein (Por secretion system target) [Ichthyenterobacterium magnum]